MTTYRVGILDDDESKVTEIVDKLNHAFDNLPQYRNYELVPVEISIESDCSSTVENILSQTVECMIIDYNLGSFQVAGYNGVEIANELWRHRKDMPVFMLTSYDENMYEHELFSAFQVFNYARYLSDDKEQDDIHKKIVRVIENFKKRIDAWERELIQLLERRGESAEIDSRILELDSELEAALDGTHAFPQKVKMDLSESNLLKLVECLDRLLEGND